MRISVSLLPVVRADGFHMSRGHYLRAASNHGFGEVQFRDVTANTIPAYDYCIKRLPSWNGSAAAHPAARSIARLRDFSKWGIGRYEIDGMRNIIRQHNSGKSPRWSTPFFCVTLPVTSLKLLFPAIFNSLTGPTRSRFRHDDSCLSPYLGQTDAELKRCPELRLSQSRHR